MSVAFGLGTRLHVRACVQNLKMASFTTNSKHSVLGMAFIDQGEFEAMKTLSGCEAARCDEHPFHAKIKVSA